jgi:RNA polymerase sigma-70 factor (sigma-E family)
MAEIAQDDPRPVDAGVPAGREYRDLFGPLFALAYRVAYSLLADRGAAEDVAQDAMARAYARWRVVRRLEEPGGWVAKVTSNLATDVWRTRTRRNHREALAQRLRVSGDSESAVLDRVDLCAALHRLPPRQRQVVVLRFVADMTEASVAKHLGCSVGAVKRHAARGLLALRSSESPPKGA